MTNEIFYYAGMSYAPISLEAVDRLSQLGVIVPYDSANEDFNTYLYIPTETYIEIKERIGTIIGDFQPITSSKIPLSHIQKQVDKVEELNAINTGDIVFCKGYHQLPFVVTHISGEQKATIYHQLKKKPLVVTTDVKLLKVAQESEIPFQRYEKKPIATSENLVIFDCDIINQKSRHQYYRYLLSAIINTKLYYIDRQLLLLNPFIISDGLIETLGIPYIITSAYNPTIPYLKIQDKKLKIDERQRAVIISNNPLIQSDKEYHNGILKSTIRTDEDIVRYISKLKRKTISGTNHLILQGRGKEPSAIRTITEYISLAERISAPIESHIDYTPATEPNVEKLEKALTRMGLKPIQAKAEDIIYTILGQG